MTETTESLVLDLGMDEQEQALADSFYDAIQRSSIESDRSDQAREFRIGVSDLGFCSERARRMLLNIPEEPTDMMLAWLGTVIGDGVEQAWKRLHPDAIIQPTVEVPLKGQSRDYYLTGHPDIIQPEEALVVDVKTDYGLTTIERTGPSRQQQFQRHMYGYGAWLAGMFGGIALEEVRVANLWVDRAGIDKRVHVDMEPFSMEVIEEAGEWLDEVVYAYLQTASGNDMWAQKEPPREMCAVVCGHYETCRALDTDVEGLLTSQEVLTALDMYTQGQQAEKVGKRLKDEAKQHLVGISGMTSDWTLRWTHVNESVVPSTVRRGYDRLDIRPIKKKG